jgi:Nuclease-related domain
MSRDSRAEPFVSDQLSTSNAAELRLASIEIFIGAPIEYASERATLLRVCEYLSAQGIPAVILANVNLTGRQIDLVVGLDRGALVTESKEFTSPVRGRENGLWEVRLASGRWKEIPNAYTQTIAEAHALRDAMGRFARNDVLYPNTALVFVPAIPAGSTIPQGDYKVSIAGVDKVPALMSAIQRRGWSLDQWRAFAAHHRLIPVSSVDAALSETLLDAERLLKSYGDAFRSTYDGPASEMIPTFAVCESQTLSSDEVIRQSAQGGNVLLTGASGCGKSLLSYNIALAALARGGVPLIVPAKDFEGKLSDVADREATLLDAKSATALISAARRLHRRLMLVVDGYNECTPAEQQRLTRSIAAAMKRYDADVVVSSRISLERADLLPVRSYAVQVPDTKAKLAIAQQAAGGVSAEPLAELLATIGSGLEARMIGQLGHRLPPGTSKYGLFDAFVRERLGLAASDGIRALSRIAGMMTDRISFGLSVRELDRLSDQEGVSGALLQTLQSANLLARRGDRVSFSHEMFLNIFAAEAIIRRAGNDPEAVIAALRLPQHLEMKPFVLGAIDDNSFRRRVLSELADKRVMRACLAGQCGSDAQLWANKRCDEVLARVEQEIQTVQFDASDKAYLHIGAKPETLEEWSQEDRAILAAVPHELIAGRRLDEVLDLVGKMDLHLLEEYSRLLGGIEDKKVPLRNSLYRASYTGFGRNEIGLSLICGPIHSGHLHDGPKVAASANLHGRLQSETLSPGQVGLLVELDRYSDRDAPSIGKVLPNLLKRIWGRSTRHLRLELMHAVAMGAHALTDDERRELIAVIEPLMPSNGGFDSIGMIDALKSLGALDDDEANYVANVKAEVDAVLADRDTPHMWDAAAGLWNAQFDHPYDGAYCEVWNSLSNDDRKSLLLMAARSADNTSMFTPSLIAEVASCADPATGPMLVGWTALPAKKEVMPQDAIRSFEMAHAAIARLRYPLPDRSAEAASPADHALLACGQIFYWLNRDDIPQAERRLNCAGSLAILSRHEEGIAAAVVGEFHRSDHMYSESAKHLPGTEPAVTSFVHLFPDDIAAIYRAALASPTTQSGYFDFFRAESVVEKALENLGRFGNASDIPVLRGWSIHPTLGHLAIQAIKTIEEAPHDKKTSAA